MQKNKKIVFDKKKIFSQFYNFKEKLNILDVGANIGQSIDYYKNIFPNSLIYSFEPQSKIYQKLLKKKKIYKDIFLFNKAIGTKKKIHLNVNLNNFRSGSSIYNFKKNSKSRLFDWHPKEKLRDLKNIKEIISMMSLDDFFKEKKLKKIDILKIDTQGYIKDVLKSFKKHLNKTSFVILEIYLDDTYNFNTDNEFLETYKILIKNNFSFYDICHIYKSYNNFHRTCWFEGVFINKKLWKNI